MQRRSLETWSFAFRCKVSFSLLNPDLTIQKVLSFVLWIILYIRNLCGIADGHLFYQYLLFLPLLLLWRLQLHSHLHPGCPECPKCLLQVTLSLLFIFLQQGRRAAGVPLPSRSHSSFHLHHHPFAHSPSQLVGQGQNTGFLLGGIQLLGARLGADMRCAQHTVALTRMRCGVG